VLRPPLDGAAHTSEFADMLKRFNATNLDEQREGLAKMLTASPIIKRKNGRVVEQFRRTTACGG
jgi:hypothetical protein